ncbi:substrate-binding periplasmic protein [Kistimonas scapharcae]
MSVRAVILLMLVLGIVTNFAQARIEDRILRVALLPDNHLPYYSAMENQDGIVRELLELIRSRADISFEPHYYPRNRQLKKIDKGELDLVPWTSEQWHQEKQSVYFTRPFAEHCNVLLFRKDQSQPVYHPRDLYGQVVGTVRDYSYQELDDYFRTGLITRINLRNELQVFDMLVKRRYDVAIAGETQARYLINHYYQDTIETGPTINCVPVSMMFSAQKEASGKLVDRILQQLMTEGEIQRLLRIWR